MKQTIEIEVPEGKKAIWKDSKVIFVDNMPKTWKEFCDTIEVKPFGEHYIETSSEIKPYTTNVHMHRRVNNDRNLLPSKEAAEAHLALMQLHQLRDYYRQGWEPKYGKESYNIFRIKTGNYSIVDDENNSNFLSFQTEEMAAEFFENFEDLIKKAGDLI